MKWNLIFTFKTPFVVTSSKPFCQISSTKNPLKYFLLNYLNLFHTNCLVSSLMLRTGLLEFWPKCQHRFLEITFWLNFCHTNCFISELRLRSDSCTPEWPKSGPAFPLQTPVVVSLVCWILGRDNHRTDTRIYAWSRVVSHLNSEFCIPSF